MTPSREGWEPPDPWAQGVGRGPQAGEGVVFGGEALEVVGMAVDCVNVPNAAECALRRG